MMEEVRSQSDSLDLNNTLIAIELFSDSVDSTDSTQTASATQRASATQSASAWHRLNQLMEPTNTFTKFLKLSCSRTKEIKMVKDLLKCTPKSTYPKTREKWVSFIGIYTQIIRLHRLYTVQPTKLTKSCTANILKMVHEFEGKYRSKLRHLLAPLRERSDFVKKDYCFHRYKTMAMCTHTPTAIVPTFAGQFGFISSEKSDISKVDSKAWCVMIDAVKDDVSKFSETVDRILSLETTDISKMLKKERRYLRILDNVCYNSLCGMIVHESLCSDDKMLKQYEELIALRAEVRNVVEKLSGKSMLFMDEMHGLDGDVLDPFFLTDDSKGGKEAWSVHLMSGILLNYWHRVK